MPTMGDQYTTKSHAMASENKRFTASTLAIHADDHLNTAIDVAPPLHVSTTFRYANNPKDLVPAVESDV